MFSDGPYEGRVGERGSRDKTWNFPYCREIYLPLQKKQSVRFFLSVYCTYPCNPRVDVLKPLTVRLTFIKRLFDSNHPSTLKAYCTDLLFLLQALIVSDLSCCRRQFVSVTAVSRQTRSQGHVTSVPARVRLAGNYRDNGVKPHVTVDDHHCLRWYHKRRR